MPRIFAALALATFVCSSAIASASSVYHYTAGLAANTTIVVPNMSTYLTAVDLYLTVEPAADGKLLVTGVDQTKSTITKGGVRYAVTSLLAVDSDGFNDNLLLSSAPYLDDLGLALTTACKDAPLFNIYYGLTEPHTYVITNVAGKFGAGIYILDAMTLSPVQAESGSAVAQPGGGATTNGPTYLGCFKDARPRRSDHIKGLAYESRAMQTVSTSPQMTVDACAAIAAAASAPYFGLQYKNECWLSTDLAASQRYGPSEGCTMPCAGGVGVCGGSYAISLYAVAPA